MMMQCSLNLVPSSESRLRPVRTHTPFMLVLLEEFRATAGCQTMPWGLYCRQQTQESCVVTRHAFALSVACRFCHGPCISPEPAHGLDAKKCQKKTINCGHGHCVGWPGVRPINTRLPALLRGPRRRFSQLLRMGAPR